MANAKNVHKIDDVKSFKLGLKSVYFIVPIASLVFVTLFASITILLAKKTNIFTKKSQTLDNRKQIYKSIATQDPII